MNNRVYESAILINAALEDETIKSLIEKVKETITSNGGEILEIEDWGRKRLAYQVKKSKIGYYSIFRFNSLPDLIPKLERFYQLDESILRYLTITLSKEALEQIEIDKSYQTPAVEEAPSVPEKKDEDDKKTTTVTEE